MKLRLAGLGLLLWAPLWLAWAQAPPAVKQQVTVTATRSTVGVGDTANTVDVLTPEEMAAYPALTMEERLRAHAGFELFRRSAGRVQNPTSQGISLRGLGSTAASRTLVLEDGAPLNDAFGGWVHWDEIPLEAIAGVTIATGGGSDLYGSSALGGVIDVASAEARPGLFEGETAAAGQGTRTAALRGSGASGAWAGLAAGEWFRTGGYTLVAPESRGPVDVPANVHSQSGRLEGERRMGLAAAGSRMFVTGNLLNEARGNGTPLQTNGTRLWRYLAGDDWAAGARASGRVRLFGSDESYRQTFSAINAGRSSESLSRRQAVRTQELGASSDASVHGKHLALVAGADVRDIRATDAEAPVLSGVASGLQDTSARQRFAGAFAEAQAARRGWSGAASVRVDRVANLDTRVVLAGSSGSGVTALGDRSEVVVSPRLGVVRRMALGSRWAGTVHGSGFRAFRSPTMNELYRTGQVGQETTQANAQLLSERATGWEIGGGVESRLVDLTGTYFWTEINRPVSAVLVSQTGTTIVDRRENLGQIRSEGLEMSLEVNRGGTISAAAGYQYADAVVTRFPAQASLVGNWIPEVPRNSASAQVRARSGHLGELTLAARETGRVFDDSANTYLLHGFFELDIYAERVLGRGFVAFVSGQNVLDRQVEVARTPVVTLGSPALVEGGVRFGWGVK